MMRRVVPLLALTSLLIGSIARSQPMLTRLQGPTSVGAGVSGQWWTAGKNKVSQIAMPVNFVYPVGERLQLVVATAPAFSRLVAVGAQELNGLSDVRISGHYWTPDDRFLLTFGANLPTGKHALTSEEFNVANVLAVHALAFRVPTMGQGLDFHLGAASAWEVGDFVLGAGISYLARGAFRPFYGADYEYKPGGEMNLSLGIDRTLVLFGNDARLTTDVVYSMYGEDKGAGETVFKSGDRLLIQGAVLARPGAFDLLVMVRERMKGRNKTGIGDVFAEERKNSNGNELELGSQLLFGAPQGTRPKVLIDVKLYGDNQYGTGSATLLGLGGGALLRLSGRMEVDTNLRYYMGSIKSGPKAVALSGLVVDAMARFYL
ncbi:MAG: hypothetical protein ONB15_00965 [candidate division KSB1 bacterium]|nr:hypothetical protein [candidate division KSB1 bacterium]